MLMEKLSNMGITRSSSSVAALALLVLVGCGDPGGKLDAFIGRAGTGGSSVTPPDAGAADAATPDGAPRDAGVRDGQGTSDAIVSSVPDVSGTMFLAAAVTINPDNPLLVTSTIELRPNADGRTAKMDVRGIPLTVNDKTPLAGAEEVSALDVTVNADLTFTADLGIIRISGAANPISGGNIEAQLVLHGRIISADKMCGTITGMVLQPLQFDAAGSTFAFTRIAPGTVGAALPSPAPAACP
jgi:hypothetical protein